LWTLIGRTGYVDARMGYANAMGYIAILLSIVFTVYFFRKLNASRTSLGMGD
jgi:multiple sugar transport system permease protein